MVRTLIVVLAFATFFCGIAGALAPGEVEPTFSESGSLSVTGSTTVLPIAERAAEEYMNQNPDADILVSGGGSSVGIQAVGEGTADIGDASRDLKDEETTAYPDLIPQEIAKDGIAIIVNPANTVESLPLEQVRGIYNGTYVNWNEVGGEDAEIVVVGRDSASGTRATFDELVMEEEPVLDTMLEKNSNGAVQQTIAGTPGSVGYVGLGYVDETVKGVSIDVAGTPVEPSIETVLSGEYPISRTLYMITNGEAQGLALDYIAFVLSDEGQAIVEEEGFVPLTAANMTADSGMTEETPMAMA